MEIKDSNRMIAEWMGYEFVTIGYFGQRKGDIDDETDWQVENRKWLDLVGIDSVGDYAVNKHKMLWFNVDDIGYDGSWEWIMPVVQRINAINLGGHLFPMGDLQRALCAADIEAVYSAVVAFIQFYNSTKNTTDE